MANVTADVISMSAEVFKLHYSELLTKEMGRLKNVTEGLASGPPEGSHT